MRSKTALCHFFLQGMLFGWATDGEHSRLIVSQSPDFPGHKLIHYEDGDLVLIDAYCIGMNGRSAGTTTILDRGIPVWHMNYHGWYKDEVIDPLKRALSSTYAKGIFVGGRGEDQLTQGNDGALYRYSNTVRKRDFFDFEGIEIMTSRDDALMMGYHEYSGIALF